MSKSLFIGFPEQAGFLLMLSDIGSFWILDTDNKILLVVDSCHSVEETCLLIPKGNPSNSISLFLLGSLGF